MKTCIYFIKIFFLILFNDILDISMWFGIRIKKILIYIFNACKKIGSKSIHILGVIFKALKNIIIILIKFLIRAIKYIAFIISDLYINLKYKLFIAYLKHKEKPQKYPKLYKGEEIIEDTTTEVKEKNVEKIQEEIPEVVEKIEEENPEEKVIEVETEDIQGVINSKKFSIGKVIKSIFVLFTWILSLEIALSSIVVAENTLLAIDLNKPFLYKLTILTRDQATTLIFIGIFFLIIAICEFLVFLFKFITCRPILQKRWFSNFTSAIIFSYLSGMCLVAKEEIKTALENGSIKNIDIMNIIEKLLPFLAIIFFVYGAIKLIVSFDKMVHKDSTIK